MADEYRKLTREELDELAGGDLPERAAMSLVNADLAIPVAPAANANGTAREGEECPPITES